MAYIVNINNIIFHSGIYINVSLNIQILARVFDNLIKLKPILNRPFFEKALQYFLMF